MKKRFLLKKHYQFLAKSMLALLLLLNFSGVAIAQDRSVTGTVTNDAGSPLPGVNIILKGTTTGTVSDLNGKFAIKVPVANSTLLITYVGYTNKEISVGEEANLIVVLQEDVQQLNEVVVIGYGVQKKSDLTGAVASVKPDELTKSPVTSIDAALQGKAAGVQVEQNTGAPGSGIFVRVRGISTLTSVNGQNQGQPMWIVDGVGASPNSVNASDIESFEILKDASSAAIYGANGANGVILITTKKGKAGKTETKIDYYHGLQDVPNRINVASGPQFGAMYTEYQAMQAYDPIKNQFQPINADKTLGTVTTPKNVQFPNFSSLPTYNYQDMVFRTAVMDNFNFNVSGGTDKSSSYFGLGFINQDGILKSSSYEKLNMRLNNSYSVTKWFKVGENASFTQNKTSGYDEWQYQSEYASPINAAITRQPNLPAYAYDPVKGGINYVKRDIGNTDDPMQGIDMMHHDNKYYGGNMTVFGIIEPFKGLTLESRMTSNIGFGDGYTFAPTYNYGSSPGQYNSIPSISRNMNKDFGYTWQNIATYNTTLLNDFNLGAVGGYEVHEEEGMNINGYRQYLLTQDPEMWYFNASTDDTTKAQIVTGTGYKRTSYSYLGRVSFDYKGKYLIQGNFRRDYSSKFGPSNRYGNFPGVSVGWKFSEEDFVKNNVSFLSFGKLRYAYGIAGNSAIQDYAYYTTTAPTTTWNYAFNNTSSEATGAGPNVFPNLAVHWEKIITQNFGADLAFFDNRLNVTVDRFARYNVGMLIPNTISGVTGWTVRDLFQENNNIDARPIENLGKITNKGWEFTLGWKDKLGDLAYSVDLNYTYVRNIATDLGKDSIKWGGGFLNLKNFTRTITGSNIGDFYGYKVERIFGPNDPIRYVKLSPSSKFYTPIVIDQPYTTKANALDPTKTDTTFMQPFAQRGDFKFADLNGDKKLTDAGDKTILGNPYPRHLLGVTFNFSYGWFDLSMFWQGTFGNSIWNAVKYYGENQSGLYNWSSDYVNSHYRDMDVIAKDVNGNVIATFPANTNAKYPRLDIANRNQNFDKLSSFYVEDGSYLRLKNLQLGMKLPNKWTSKIDISEFRVYIGAGNLLTFTKYTGMDPEVAQNDPFAAGIDKAAYPKARSVTFGASVKF
jgi:TonB-linked SusC/RagA family outer membrane protein